MHRLLLVLLVISITCLVTEGYLFGNRLMTTSEKLPDLSEGIPEHLPPLLKAAVAALVTGDEEAFRRYLLQFKMNNTLPKSEDNTAGSQRGQGRRDTDDDLTRFRQLFIDFFTNPQKFWSRFFGIPIEEGTLEIPETTTMSADQVFGIPTSKDGQELP